MINNLKHVAVIMDGNGRWAKKRELPLINGHQKGADAAINLIETCIKHNIQMLTLYAFSTENWKRPKNVVDALMILLSEYITKHKNLLIEHNVKLKIIGDVSRLDLDLQKKLYDIEKETFEMKGLKLHVALNYGGRDEIIRVCKKIHQNINKEAEINEELFASYLDYGMTFDPDIIIRTGGEQRLSNFLLWQSAYSELYFTEVLWPDFKEEHFLQAIQEYNKRVRKYGEV